MVTQGVIMAILIVMAVLGIVPAAIGIILLATKKLKASAFWSGVGIAMISTIIASIAVIAISAVRGKPLTEMTDISDLIIQQIIMVVANIGFIFLFLKCVLKKSQNFKGAVSLATGYGIVNMLTYAFSMLSNYSTAVLINQGLFDAQYKQVIEMGMVDTETVKMLKQQILDLKAADIFMYIPNVIAVLMMLVAVCVLIVKGITNKKIMPDLIVATALHLAVSILSLVITNVYAAVAVIFVLSLAACIYAVKTRGDIKEPEPIKIENDSFMQTVISAQNDDNSNPYNE